MPTGVAYQVGSTLIPDGAHLAALGHGGLHEVNAAPRLNADGTLQAGSPAIDSADSAAAGETDTDLLGTARRDDTGVCDTGPARGRSTIAARSNSRARPVRLWRARRR